MDEVEPLAVGEWRRSSRCESSACAEATIFAGTGPLIGFRHSRAMPHHVGMFLFTVAEWQAFIDGVKAGEFDLEAR